ncbi:MAG: bifunctional DNA-formamidopyrimidine glycosylase/DNA-(apurinic or apyrimidinic site) lyase [Bdellovibrionota bacterium]
MPELPEVETVARQLNQQIRGKKVLWLKAYDPRLKLPKHIKLTNSKVEKVFRMGKQIIVSFQGAPKKFSHLAIHLRMSGNLISLTDSARSKTETPVHHIRSDLKLSKGCVCFVDPRRFGTMVFSDKLERFVPKGVEPFSDEFTIDKIQELIAKTSTPIKPWLLKQEKIVGIGNIYASEILYRCKLSPLKPAGKLKLAELKALHSSIVYILDKAIENCGTTFSDFQDAYGVTGSYQSFLKVYDREGEKCRRCKSKIEKIVQAQRSTYYCPTCQK